MTGLSQLFGLSRLVGPRPLLYKLIRSTLLLSAFLLLAACSSGEQPQQSVEPTRAAENSTPVTESTGADEPTANEASATQTPPAPVAATIEPESTKPAAEVSEVSQVSEVAVIVTERAPAAPTIDTIDTIDNNRPPTRIEFATGSTSGSATGRVVPGQIHRYLLGAQAEQQMSVAFTSDSNGKALISIHGADGQALTENVLGANVTLPSTQDYIVSVIGQSDSPFEYEVVMSISALAVVPSVENVGYAERAAWLDFLNVPASCESDFQLNADYYREQNLSGITFYLVEPQKHKAGRHAYVVEVLCTTFAYSFHSRLYLYNAETQSATPLLLQEIGPDQTLQQTEILFGSSFGLDAEGQQFTNFQKGRGSGDCGFFYTYQFQSDNLTLLEARFRECSETAEEYIPPYEWDVIYP